MIKRCFLLQPTNKARCWLKRYNTYKCKFNKFHEAKTQIEDSLCNIGMNGYIYITLQYNENDQRWPTECACGYKFANNDNKQLWYSQIFTHKNKEYTLEEAPVGAMWYSNCIFKGHDNKNLTIQTPNGPWHIDIPKNKERWLRVGIPPKISVYPSITINNETYQINNGILSIVYLTP